MVNNSTTGDSERVYLNEEDCDSIFQIPSHLVESYGVTLPSKASLKVDGKKWSVSIEKFKDNYFFTNGWKEFAEQVNLKSLDWLKFKSASCLPEIGKERIRNESDNEIENKGKCSRNVSKLSFTSEIKNYNRNRLNIPKYFVVGSKIHKGENLRLRDSEGREWPVRVTVRSDIFSLCRGLSAFLIGNKVMIGSKISFSWLSGNMLQAKVVEVGTDEQPQYIAARNRSGKDEGEGSEKKKSPLASRGKMSFKKEIKNYHRYCLDIPKDFATNTGICKDEEIKLKNGEGMEWPVLVTRRDKSHNYTMYIGWSNFAIDNKLMLGSTISFTWLSGKILQTEISDVGTDKQPLFSSANKRCL